jgi:hypothetical protein
MSNKIDFSGSGEKAKIKENKAYIFLVDLPLMLQAQTIGG